MEPLLQDINSGKTLIDLSLIVIGILAGYGRLRREVLQDFQHKNLLLQDDLRAVRAVCQTLEKRLARMEVNDRRKSRQLAARGREITYLEQIVRVAVEALTSAGQQEDNPALTQILAQIDGLTDELNAFRLEEGQAQEKWEAEQTPILLAETWPEPSSR